LCKKYSVIDDIRLMESAMALPKVIPLSGIYSMPIIYFSDLNSFLLRNV
jgi:hypothetical protein